MSATCKTASRRRKQPKQSSLRRQASDQRDQDCQRCLGAIGNLDPTPKDGGGVCVVVRRAMQSISAWRAGSVARGGFRWFQTALHKVKRESELWMSFHGEKARRFLLALVL